MGFLTTRRDFLKAGGGLLGIAALGGMAAEGKSRIPIGFLGVTYSHGPDKVKLTLSSPDWEFMGVCDESPGGRAICERLGAKRLTQDELFERTQVIAVESEVREHARDALLALNAGKHVHLEKPPATKLADMQRIVDLAQKKHLLLQTGYMWRYNPGFKTIFEAVRQGWLGDIFLVRGFISNNLVPARRPGWNEFKGGALFELGSHLVDAIVRLLGKPKAVHSFLRRQGNFDDDLKDNNVVIFEYARASAVLINTALHTGTTPPRSFEVLGTKGTATLQPIEPPALMMELAERAGPYQKGLHQVAMPNYNRYEGDFAELAAAVRGETRLSASLDEELLVAETLLQVSGM